MKVLTESMVFYGSEIDPQDGLPRPFRNYTVVADEAPGGYGRAWVWCNSEAAEGETRFGPIHVLEGGRLAAYQEAIRRLREAPSNRGLRVHAFGPVEQDWHDAETRA